MMNGTDVVTGAFGYIGRYIARYLLSQGRAVRTITTHPWKTNSVGMTIEAQPFHFDQPELLIKALKGADTLYNTYWVRFEYGGVTFDQAVKNSITLFRCAVEAGIRKIVHISVSQAADSELPYFRGKAAVEKALIDSGLPYAIVRPTVVFGKEDILINNIAWMIRKFPAFPIFGSGQYSIQPVYVQDLAKIAVQNATRKDSSIMDAVGPETFSFEALVQLIADKIGRKITLMHVPPALGIFFGGLIGWIVRDVVLTREELQGLMENLLCSQKPPIGETKFSDWLEANKKLIGLDYSSELERHFRVGTP